MEPNNPVTPTPAPTSQPSMVPNPIPTQAPPPIQPTAADLVGNDSNGQNSSSGNKIVIFFVIGIVVILAIVGGIYFFLSQQQNPQTETKPMVVAQTPSPSPEDLEGELNTIDIPADIDELNALDQDLQNL